MAWTNGTLFSLKNRAPHKFTLPHLRSRLRGPWVYLIMLSAEPRNRTRRTQRLLRYYADRLVAAAIWQTFHYMIENDLGYSLLTTGEAIVFLKISWGTPAVLNDHHAVPGEEARDHQDNFRYCSRCSGPGLQPHGPSTHQRTARTNADGQLHV